LRKIVNELLIGDVNIDLLGNIEISIQIEVDLGLPGELKIEITGQEEDACHDWEDEEGDLDLQAERFLKPPLPGHRVKPLV
jgi:hypothetical protein